MKSSKLEKLEELKERLNIEINGLENYFQNDNPSLVVANHSCLMDIFYLPLAIPEDTVSLISPRIMYKKIPERQKLIQKYLYAMPIEAHGGINYTNICLEEATRLLCNGISLNIFPEGAYVPDNSVVYKGRTGASRILYGALAKGVAVNLIPVSIDIKEKIIDLDSYDIENYKIEISILSNINYDEYFQGYLSSAAEQKIRNKFLHKPIDEALKSIATRLNKPYIYNYIDLYPKNNVIFQDGTLISKDIANKGEYLELYRTELHKYSTNLCKTLSRNRK